MIFNSIDFLVFFLILFIVYWLIETYKPKYINITLLIASYIFYGWWDWRFLGLIVLSSCVDYTIALQIKKNEVKQASKKMLLILSLFVNLGLLIYFKYFNFFIDSFVESFKLLGYNFSADRLSIILPVGISFYTFQTLSYTIDVYRGKLEPSQSVVKFFTYVSFFPQLVAGPIERATNLLPQFSLKKEFEYQTAIVGLRLVLWGLFKKVVIADNCAVVVNQVFSTYEDQSGAMLLYASVLFAFQIYGDFSGYSDIAIGIARLLGFKLMKNFAFPYFSRDIAEFWRRWHISLSTWFRDYLYIPLGGSRGTRMNQIRNISIVFIVSGFWHGANWTFIIWGALNALYFFPIFFMNKNRDNLGGINSSGVFNKLKMFAGIITTFGLTCLAWIFFRSENVQQAVEIILKIFSNSVFSRVDIDRNMLVLILCFMIWEWLNRNKEYGLELLDCFKFKPLRWGVYYLLIALIVIFANTSEEFIYFQF